MEKKRVFLSACGATMLGLSLCSCGSSFEGSGSKDAATAEQLSMRLDDPWAFEITVDPSKRAEGNLQNGIYSGIGQGMGGSISVTLLVEDKHITCLSITQEGETQSVGGYEAIRDGLYAEMINAAQGSDIDAISGATITTLGVKQAVEEALTHAEAGEQAAPNAAQDSAAKTTESNNASAANTQGNGGTNG